MLNKLIADIVIVSVIWIGIHKEYDNVNVRTISYDAGHKN